MPFMKLSLRGSKLGRAGCEIPQSSAEHGLAGVQGLCGARSLPRHASLPPSLAVVSRSEYVFRSGEAETGDQ